MKTCTICGTLNEDTQQVCYACGAELEKPAQTPPKKKKSFFGKKKEETKAEDQDKPKVCPVCATENPAGETICYCCGSELKNARPQKPQAEPQYCPVCGMECEAGVYLCPNCGAEVTPPRENNQKQKKTGLKAGWIKWAVAGLALVGLIGGGAAVALSTDEAEIYRGGVNLGTQLAEKMQQLQNLIDAREHLENLMKSGEYSVALRLDVGDVDASAVLHYDIKDKIMDGALEYENAADEVLLNFDFSSDNKKFMLASDRITADIYGFALADFQKTPLAKILPLPVNEKGELDLFQKTDFSTQMENKYGTAWKNLVDSVEYNEINDRDMTIGGKVCHVRAFELTWDDRAMVELANAMLGRTKDFLGGFSELAKHLKPDCRLYINEDHQIVAVDFVAAGNKCLIEFAGEENPWENCIVSSQALGGGQGVAEGYLTIQDGVVEGRLRLMSNTSYAVDYNDTTGDFRISATVKDKQWDLTGCCTSDQGSASLELYGLWGDLGNVNISVALEPLEKTPEHLSRNYVDLMSMSSSDWQRLLIELSN